MIIDDQRYDLFGKYSQDSAQIGFEPNELAFLYDALNIRPEPNGFEESRLDDYVANIRTALEEQNRALTRLLGEFLRLKASGSELEPYLYLVRNIAEIKSMFILQNVVRIVMPMRVG
jgi:hypothetical protein